MKILLTITTCVLLLGPGAVCAGETYDKLDHNDCLEKKQPTRALQLSGLTTLVGVGVGGAVTALAIAPIESPLLFAFGVITTGLFLSFGPSAGHFYVNNNLQAWLNSILRLGLTTAFTIGLTNSIFSNGAEYRCANDDVACQEQADSEMVFWPAFTWVTGGLAVGLALFDIFTSKRAAKKANEKNCAEVNVTLTPVVVPTSGGGLLGVGGRF